MLLPAVRCPVSLLQDGAQLFNCQAGVASVQHRMTIWADGSQLRHWVNLVFHANFRNRRQMMNVNVVLP